MNILTNVFIASSFNEFSELRGLLRDRINHNQFRNLECKAIDLNDGGVSYLAPIDECLRWVRKSEFMILLIGENYGSCPKNFTKSYTQLEWEETLDCDCRVLVFAIHPEYVLNNKIESSNIGKEMQEWVTKINEKSTYSTLDPNLSATELAETIFFSLIDAVYQYKIGINLEPTESEDQGFNINDESLTDDFESNDLEKINLQNNENVNIELDCDENVPKTIEDSIRKPGAIACYEQRVEAKIAIDLGYYNTALGHLSKALELSPLNFYANYWFVKITAALGRKNHFNKAIECADRCLRISNAKSSKNLTTTSYRNLSMLYESFGYVNEAILNMKEAVKVWPTWANLKLELARLEIQNKNYNGAIFLVESAINIRHLSLFAALSDKRFKPIFPQLYKLRDQLIEKYTLEIINLYDFENRISRLCEIKFVAIQIPSDLKNIIYAGNESIKRQHRMISDLLTRVKQTKFNAITDRWMLRQTQIIRVQQHHNIGISNIEWHKTLGSYINYGDVVFSYLKDNKMSEWKYPLKCQGRINRIFTQNAASADDPIFEICFEENDYSKFGEALQHCVAIDNLNSQKRNTQDQLTGSLNTLKTLELSDASEMYINRLWLFTRITLPVTGIVNYQFEYYAMTVIAIALYALFTYKNNFCNFAKSVARLYFKLKNNQPITKQQIIAKDLTANLADIDIKIAWHKKSINDLTATYKELVSKFIAAIDVFESRTLNTPRPLLMYRAGKNGKPNELIRVKYSDKQTQGGHNIIDDFDIPLLAKQSLNNNILTRLVTTNDNHVIASHLFAYLPVKMILLLDCV